MDFEYIVSKQGEWREIYETQRRRYKLEKGRAEKERNKERKIKNKIDLNTFSNNINKENGRVESFN